MTSIYQVDSFAHAPFTGNPAGVCPLSSSPSEEWMQNVAMEMNLSETAFFWPEQEGYRLRWFTPTLEVDLCGHGTLAVAHILYEQGMLPPNVPAIFYTKSGQLTATKSQNLIEMDFPSRPAHPANVPVGLMDVAALEPLFVGYFRKDLLVEIASESELRQLRPDFAKLKEVDCRTLIVTARSFSGECDFVSRFFAPHEGLDEDPVTGSAHCVLGPYWQTKLNKNTLVGFQASKRGGFVNVRVAGDRIFLSGQAHTVFSGKLFC